MIIIIMIMIIIMITIMLIISIEKVSKHGLEFYSFNGQKSHIWF